MIAIPLRRDTESGLQACSPIFFSEDGAGRAGCELARPIISPTTELSRTRNETERYRLDLHSGQSLITAVLLPVSISFSSDVSLDVLSNEL